MKKTRITITHQIEKTVHHFFVMNPKKLTRDEVKRIAEKINVAALFVEGKIYSV